MGALLFFGLLALMFIIAMPVVVLTIIFIIIWNVDKHKGRKPKKWRLIVPVVFLIISSLVALIPVGYIGFLRYMNSTQFNDIVYSDSGRMLYWPTDENHDITTEWFEMDGRKYTEQGYSGNFGFDVDTENDERLGKPVGNITGSPLAIGPLNNFMSVLLAGNTMDKLVVSTIYPIKNNKGFELYALSGSCGNGIYCPEDQLDSINAYYDDTANYDMQNLVCVYTVYTEGEGSGERGNSSYIDLKKEVKVTPGTFEKISQLYNSGQQTVRVEIPQKYNDADKAEVPGTPIFGYEEYRLSVYSKDKLACMDAVLVLIDTQVYAEVESGDNYITGYPLPAELNQHIINTVFT